LVYRMQLIKSTLACISTANTVNNKHPFTQKCKVAQNSEKIWTFCSSTHPRSSTLVPIESVYATSY